MTQQEREEAKATHEKRNHENRDRGEAGSACFRKSWITPLVLSPAACCKDKGKTNKQPTETRTVSNHQWPPSSSHELSRTMELPDQTTKKTIKKQWSVNSSVICMSFLIWVGDEENHVTSFLSNSRTSQSIITPRPLIKRKPSSAL